jgi:hypothetical protein
MNIGNISESVPAIRAHQSQVLPKESAQFTEKRSGKINRKQKSPRLLAEGFSMKIVEITLQSG